MGYANESGYTPETIEDIMLSFMTNINAQFGTTYTFESFVATNFYKYYYAMAQRMQENEIKTSEIFLKLQQYFIITNEKIARPVATAQGILEKLAQPTELAPSGYIASVKPPSDPDAGKLYIAVDVLGSEDNYADIKLEIATIIKNSIAAGIITQGSESETIVLSNGQSFDFKYNLPDRKPVELRLTLTLSENNQVLIGSPEEVALKLLNNILANYKLGKNFEPERYFGVNDAPWAGNVLLEYSFDYDPEDPGSATWSSDIYNADYDELIEVSLEKIQVVED